MYRAFVLGRQSPYLMCMERDEDAATTTYELQDGRYQVTINVRNQQLEWSWTQTLTPTYTKSGKVEWV